MASVQVGSQLIAPVSRSVARRFSGISPAWGALRGAWTGKVAGRTDQLLIGTDYALVVVADERDALIPWDQIASWKGGHLTLVNGATVSIDFTTAQNRVDATSLSSELMSGGTEVTPTINAAVEEPGYGSQTAEWRRLRNMGMTDSLSQRYAKYRMALEGERLAFSAILDARSWSDYASAVFQDMMLETLTDNGAQAERSGSSLDALVQSVERIETLLTEIRNDLRSHRVDEESWRSVPPDLGPSETA